MKQLGILGGLSWISSAEYYRILNEEFSKRTALDQNPKIVLNSIDFSEATKAFKNQNNANQLMLKEAAKLDATGCDLMIIASNTAHFCFDAIESSTNTPMIHIADAVGGRLKALGVQKALLLGTRYTMNLDFYKKRLQDHFNIDVVIPEPEDKVEVNRIIYQELVKQNFTSSAQEEYLRIISKEASKGADAVIMGCTEIPLLLKGCKSPIPLVDSVWEHCIKTLDRMLS